MRKALLLLTLSSAAAASHAATFSEAELCKATVAVEMGRDVGSMNTAKPSDGLAHIWYIRNNDGQKFFYRCRIEGARVVWSTFLTDTGSWGRWRDNYPAGDAETTYSVSGDTLTILNSDMGSKQFTKGDF